MLKYYVDATGMSKDEVVRVFFKDTGEDTRITAQEAKSLGMVHIVSKRNLNLKRKILPSWLA